MSGQNDLLLIGEAARILGLSAATLRMWGDTGKLPVAMRASNGVRLYRRADIEQLAATRAEAKGGARSC